MQKQQHKSWQDGFNECFLERMPLPSACTEECGTTHASTELGKTKRLEIF